MQCRLGPRRYGVNGSGDVVRLSEDTRNCVVFIGWQKAGPVDDAPIDPIGTGFLVTNEQKSGSAFLVTAKHVAKKVHTPLVIRYNHRDGKSRLLHVHRPAEARWCYHDDPTVDLAVMPLDLPSSFEGSAYLLGSIMDPEGDEKIIRELDAGDFVAVVGLFSFRHGSKRNLPIVHMGHIAMLPTDEPIPIDGKDVEGYLVQANATSGCSGSPVFAASWKTMMLAGAKFLIGLDTKVVLLGVWSSSWKVEGSQIMSVRTDDDDEKKTAAPLGMGIVIPADKLRSIFTGDQMKKALDDLDHTTKARRSPTEDAASSVPAPLPNDANPTLPTGTL